MSSNSAIQEAPQNVSKFRNYLRRTWTLYLMLILPIAFFVIFGISP